MLPCDTLPRQQIAKGDDVDVVVRVHVADDDRVEIPRVADLHELPDHPLPAVDQDRGGGGLDQQAGGGRLGLR